MDVTLNGHEVYRFVYHVVWVKKYRRKLQNPNVAEYLWHMLPQLARSMSGVICRADGV